VTSLMLFVLFGERLDAVAIVGMTPRGRRVSGQPAGVTKKQ